MRSTTLFHSAMNFLIGSFFLLVGILALVLPWVNSIRQAAVNFLLTNSSTVTVLGLGAIAVGFSLLASASRKNRHYYQLKTGDNSVKISEEVLDQYVYVYWERLFPGQEFVSHVVIKNNQIKITADLPPLPFNEQRSFLETAEKELTELFAKNLHYHDAFSLSVSFADLPTPSEKLS